MPALKSQTKAENTGLDEEISTEVARRLVVELTRKSAQDLGWLVDEEELNKTTLVNRAIQVYKTVMEAQKDGRRLMISNRDGTQADVLWIM